MIVTELKAAQDGVLSAVVRAEQADERPSVEEYMDAMDRAARQAGFWPAGRAAWCAVPGQDNALEITVCQLPPVELGQYLGLPLVAARDAAARRMAAGRLVEQVVQQAVLTVPLFAVDTENEAQWRLLQGRLEKSHITLPQHLARLRQSEDAFRAKLRGYSEQDMRKRMVLLAVARAEGMTVTDGELQAAVLDAQRHGIRRPDRMQLRQKLLTQKAAARILEQAELREPGAELVGEQLE